MGKTVGGAPEAFTWDTAASLPLLLEDGALKIASGPGGLPVEQSNGTTTQWYLHDQLGSTRALTDNTGRAVATYAYGAYGAQASATGSASTPLLYAGQYRDAESGLYYLRARYYDPSTGQFLSRDPLVAATRSAYAYVYSNPLNSTDPSGLDCGIFSPGACIGDVVGAVSDAATWTMDHVAKPLGQATLDVVATPFYATYYASYYAASGINWVGSKLGTPGSVTSHIIAAPLAIPEAIGLGGDVGIDWIKGHTVNNERTCDEGQNGYLNPLHSFLPNRLKGPQVYLPGVHSDGHVDFEW